MDPIPVIRYSYLALVLWPWLWWLWGVPAKGTGGWWMAAVLSVLFALPLKGIWQLKHSSTVWGGFLALLAFMLGIMEAWTVAAECLPGMIYTGLALAYILGLWLRSRGDD